MRRDAGCVGAGRDVTCAENAGHQRKKLPMKKLIAPLTFTFAAMYVVVLFVLAHSTP